ncbi:YicC/YloC family endoribonuclease [Salidesulfovibrio onnuriiensis]|uniref:YicC/YloC family endoribonuclease n=1 Tax=Salidesulfovibrio onnuriiensis TaxID=2583823 RepID=UPI0011CAA713|nr:YicC/YloC family endoribonuclease [Salidesulfovibrio onnuriiensis]
MPVSMTGYGRFETNEDSWAHVWEIRSVNGRFLDVKWRLPYTVRSLENGWEKVVRKYASRGRVDVSLNLEMLSAEELGVAFNEPLAKSMIGQMEALAGQYGATFVPDFNKILGMSSLWKDTNSEPEPGLAKSLTAGLEGALRNWKESRKVEGEAMTRDLLERVTVLRGLSERIAVRIPEVLEIRRQALRDRIREIMEAVGAEYNEDRMLQEIAILTDKLDVSEELTRLATHLDRLEEVLGKDKDAGKKLDFLLQETFREINTCGNKAQDTEVSGLVVDFKAELEKCREQVQNIE